MLGRISNGLDGLERQQSMLLMTRESIDDDAEWRVGREIDKQIVGLRSMALEQARHSFYSAQYAMGVGLLAVIGFATIAVLAPTIGGVVIAGTATAVIGGVTAYITKTFRKAHDVASERVKELYDLPANIARQMQIRNLILSITDDAARADVIKSYVIQEYPRISHLAELESNGKKRRRTKDQDTSAP